MGSPRNKTREEAFCRALQRRIKLGATATLGTPAPPRCALLGVCKARPRRGEPRVLWNEDEDNEAAGGRQARVRRQDGRSRGARLTPAGRAGHDGEDAPTPACLGSSCHPPPPAPQHGREGPATDRESRSGRNRFSASKISTANISTLSVLKLNDFGVCLHSAINI